MTDPVTTPAARSRSIASVVGLIAGLPMMAIGVAFAVTERDDVRPFELARWAVGIDLVSDLIVIPAAATLAWLIGRWAPPVARGALRWATFTTAILALYAWPFVRGYGKNASVPSLLDRDYASGLAAYVAAVWVLAIVWIAVCVLRRRWSDQSSSISASSSTTACSRSQSP